MKTYTGTIVSAAVNRVTIDVGADRWLDLWAATRIASEAAAMIGRRVSFQAELSERTQCLTQVQLCVRSEFGLRAVQESTRASGVRDVITFGSDPSVAKGAGW